MFKEKIQFNQYISMTLQQTLHFLEEHYASLLPLADEYKVVDKKITDELYEKLQLFMVAHIVVECHIMLSRKLSAAEVSEIVTRVYCGYLMAEKNVAEADVELHVSPLMRLWNEFDKEMLRQQETDEYNKSIGRTVKIQMNSDDQYRFHLCHAFSKWCKGDDSKTAEGREFAAFKLAKAIVKNNLPVALVKGYKIEL